MVNLYKQGQSVAQIADAAGCATVSVLRQIKNAGIYKSRKEAQAESKAAYIEARDAYFEEADATAKRNREKKEQQEKAKQAKHVKQVDYLYWVANGAMCKVDGESFIEKLLVDIQSGRLG